MATVLAIWLQTEQLLVLRDERLPRLHAAVDARGGELVPQQSLRLAWCLLSIR